MSQAYDKLMRCYESVRQKIDFKPQVALILGSGLGDYGDSENVSVHAVLEYSEIEGFPVSTVSGHKGRFIFGYVKEVPVVIMQGRVHYYEGYPMEDVVLPVRLMKLMGAEVLFLTNASGGISFQAGDFMMITGQISSFIPSPLIGPNMDELGLRFPDMSEIYKKDLRTVLKNTADELSIPLKEGIYIQFTGPAYESPEEIRMAKILGADAVGMSTACEAIAANHMGMRVCGISCVTNLAAGISKNPLTHEEVKETADRVAPLFQRLVTACIQNIHKEI